MNRTNQYVVFALDEWQIALRLAGVDRVVWAVGVTPLPQAPEIVSGVINVQGRIMPVVNLRRRFGLAAREMDPGDRFLIAHTAQRTVALWVDEVSGVIEPAAEEVVRGEEIVPGMGYVEGVIKLPDGMILIHDLERFLSIEEEKRLGRVIEESEV